MQKDFVMNVSILISFFFILSHLFKNYLVNSQSSRQTRVMYGVLLGGVGVVLMMYSIKVTPKVVIDLRHLVIVIAAVYGGLISSLVSASIVAVARIWLFGISEVAVKVAFYMLLIGGGCGLLSLLRLSSWKKFLVMNLFSMLVVSFVLYVNVAQKDMLSTIYANHWAMSMLGGALAFAIVRYITGSHNLFRKLEESENKYRLIAENMSDLLAVLNKQGVVKYASPSHKTLLGLDPEEYLGQMPLAYIHPDDVPRVRKAFFEMVESNRSMTIEFRWKHQDGRWLVLDMRCKSVIGEAGKVTNVVVVSRDITAQKETEQKLREANEKLQNLSNLDGLTGVANRRCFEERLKQEWHRGKRQAAPLSLVLFDIDYFKSYNDTYGHQGGDRCLQEVARTAKSVIKRSSDLIARYGGEEFAVILPETDETGAAHVAEEIRLAVEALAIPHAGSKVDSVVTISVGVCTVRTDGMLRPEELIANADLALYQAKSAGRKQVKSFSWNTGT